MKVNQWTIGLAAAGVISFGAVAQAEEKPSSQVLTAVSSTTLSGYVSTSAQWNPGSQPGAVAAYSYGAGKGDGFNLNVVDITISKPLDEGEWAAGYTAELWFGPDAAGLGNAIGGTSAGGAAPVAASVNGIAIKQAFVALNAPIGNGITLKMGIFDTIIGYEAANAGDNPNYTRSYGYTIEPTQHTGVLASYKVCEAFSLTAGIANTFNAALNARAGGPVSQSQKTYMAGISLTAPDSWGFLKGAVLNAGVVDGRASGAAAGAPDTTSLYVGATIPTPWETIKTGVSWDHLQFAKTTGVATKDADAVGAYVAFSGIEKLKINARVEYFNDADGGNAIVGGTDVLATTVTLDYALWANVISRLEYRWDHDLKQLNSLGGNSLTTAAGVGSGNNNNHLLALNLIYKF